MFYLLQHSTYPLKSVELDFDHSNRLMGFASGFFVHADQIAARNKFEKDHSTLKGKCGRIRHTKQNAAFEEYPNKDDRSAPYYR